MTKLLVLGLLEDQTLSGYDIQQILNQTDSECWGGILTGSIYHALKKMESEGLIEVFSIEQTGLRQKAVYQITDKGREQLKELAREALETPCALYPTMLYSGLSYVDKLPREEALQALNAHASALSQEYKTLEKSLIAKNTEMDGVLPDMTKLVFKNMFAIIRQQQDFLSKAMQILRG